MIRLQQQNFDISAEQALLLQHDNTGALVSFVGRVRAADDGEHIANLTLEHYPGMTEKSMQAIEDEARSRWPLNHVCIIHRIGTLQAGEQIVFIGVGSAHRAAAFAACEFLIDRLKTQVLLWKKQTDVHGNSRWLEQKTGDVMADTKWKTAS